MSLSKDGAICSGKGKDAGHGLRDSAYRL